MKVKLFTHNDLDGIGCAILAKLAFGKVDVEYCGYDIIDEKVRDFTANMQFIHYDKVFITDISVSKEVADLIDYSIVEKSEYLGKYQLIDHHKTAKWLNDYTWAIVDDLEVSVYPNEIEMKSSGTSMFCDYLWSNDHLISNIHIERFVEKVRRYDTWEWATKFNDNDAKQLNDLLYIFGRERFVKRFVDDIIPTFRDYEKLILEIEQNKIENYIESKKKQMFESVLDDYEVGVVFAEQYISELGNQLALNNPHLDFIVIINVGNGTVSYRGIHDDIDLGVVAKQYGGGGHPKAAGNQTSEFVKEENWISYVEW